ncbi:MAG: SDR family oxidoreductase [Bacteroidales bacterium]|nr:SDR family oxidoreductase [Bacteroidales bacterium]
MAKLALVTGSGKRRVGFHVAHALAQHGYDIAVHYRSSAREAVDITAELKALGVRAEPFRAELSDEQSVKHLVSEVIGSFGQIDVLVNAAAIWHPKPLEAITAADVREHWEANTLGTFLTCQHVGLWMVAQRNGGSIINIGDWAEVRPYPDHAAYFPSKAAIPGLTRTFAVELARRNTKVRVNAILPGPVMLPDNLPEHDKQEAINATLVKQEGSPENIAQAVLALVENSFITGVCLPVDGGRTIYAGGL